MALRPRVIGGVPATPEEEAAAAAARSRWSCARCKRWCAGVLAVAAVLGVAYSRLAYGGPSGRSGGETWYRPSTWRDYAASRVPRNASARLAELEVWRGNATVRLSALERSNSRLRGRVDALEETVATLESPAGEPGLAAQMAAQNASLAALGARQAALERKQRDDAASSAAALDAIDARQGREDETFRGYADSAARAAEARSDAKTAEVAATLGDYESTTGDKLDMERDLIYHWIAGTFTLLCCLIAATGAFSHSRQFAAPDIQRKILALLWMPPTYAICCWLSLLYPSAASGLSIIRDGYEAYTIWVFVAFLVSVLASEGRPRDAPVQPSRSKYAAVVARLADDDSSGAHALPRAFWPPPCCGRKPPAKAFLRQCMVAVMQFVLLKPLLGVADYALGAASWARGDSLGVTWVTRARLAIVVAQNLSVSIALTGLLKVYHATAHRLQHHNPWPKFCCVKGVVFLSFWQGTVIWALTCTETANPFASKEMADAVQNFLICVEMFVAAVVHSYTFSADEWQPGYRPGPVVHVSDNLAVGDFVSDVRYAFSRGSIRARDSSAASDLKDLKDAGDQTPVSGDGDAPTADPRAATPPRRPPSADGKSQADAAAWSVVLASDAATTPPPDSGEGDDDEGTPGTTPSPVASPAPAPSPAPSPLEAQLSESAKRLRKVPREP